MDIKPVSKAIAGALITALVSYLSTKNIVLNEEVTGAVSIVVAAVIGFVAVYFAPKNKETK